jgi:hypothetical protein
MSDIDEVIKELALEERKFLHDISNHIVVAHGMTTFVLRALKDNQAVAAKEMDRLEKALEAISQMSEQLKQRRELLHSRS